ncbi:hypothetical protein BD779DRAFT_1537192 [Infundibulicybe gibba]|nr:hypothetical protein BD779DRAFT_1537192 [Infundibulicybe gibba]
MNLKLLLVSVIVISTDAIAIPIENRGSALQPSLNFGPGPVMIPETDVSGAPLLPSGPEPVIPPRIPNSSGGGSNALHPPLHFGPGPVIRPGIGGSIPSGSKQPLKILAGVAQTPSRREDNSHQIGNMPASVLGGVVDLGTNPRPH